MKRAGPTVHMMPRRICACCRLRNFLAVDLGRLGIGEQLAQMRFDQPAEIGQMGQLALAAQQQPAKLLFELLDRAGQCRLRDMALLGRAGEIQRVGDRQKIADLMHLHAPAVPPFPDNRDNK